MHSNGRSFQTHVLYIFMRLPFLLHSLTMGNCIALPCIQPPPKTLRALENATESATTMVDAATEQGHDPLLLDFTSPTRTGLQVGEVQNVVPCLKELESLLVSSKIANSGGAGGRKVKIVVTREQFKLLLANAKKMQSRHRLLSYTGPRRGCRKWRPTLSAISEEQDF